MNRLSRIMHGNTAFQISHMLRDFSPPSSDPPFLEFGSVKMGPNRGVLVFWLTSPPRVTSAGVVMTLVDVRTKATAGAVVWGSDQAVLAALPLGQRLALAGGCFRPKSAKYGARTSLGWEWHCNTHPQVEGLIVPFPEQQPSIQDKIRNCELCGGIGGFTAALNHVRGESVMYCDIDPDCCTTFANNHPHCEVHQLDLRTWHAWSLLVHRFQVLSANMVTIGTPCQPSSNMGYQRGFGDHRDLNSSLGMWARLLRPVFLAGENVGFASSTHASGLPSMNNGQDLSAIIHDLNQAGYAAGAYQNDLADLVPQVRRRFFHICGEV